MAGLQLGLLSLKLLQFGHIMEDQLVLEGILGVLQDELRVSRVLGSWVAGVCYLGVGLSRFLLLRVLELEAGIVTTQIGSLLGLLAASLIGHG